MSLVDACGLVNERHVLLPRLRSLETADASGSQALPEWDGASSSPVRVEAWRTALAKHPDRAFAQFIVAGLTEGFRIGHGVSHVCKRGPPRNMRSAGEHPDVVQRYLDEERASGALRGPVQHPEAVHVSPFGVIPKSGPQGRWRLIVNLSSPIGGSVNDGISPAACSVEYVRLDEAVRRCARLGKGTSLVKVDIKSAYRIVPVHPDDRHLLCVAWRGDVFVDTALPFGLRSAPVIFSAVADALLWIMLDRGIQDGVHYLDDYLLLGSPATAAGERNRRIALETCAELGVPVAVQKLEGRSTCVVFLGLKLDTEKQEVRLPAEKLDRVRGLIRLWQARKKCSKRDLLSLVGLLHHAATAIPAGRSFVRRLIDLSMVRPAMHHVIRLNAEARADLFWWSTFPERWNGRGFFACIAATPSVVVQTDATGLWGCGAIAGSVWFSHQWSPSWRSEKIAAKELAKVVVAAAVWGRDWTGSSVLIESDNSTVVAAVNSGSSRDASLMPLLRSLQFVKAMFAFSLRARHIPGALNVVADGLSRNRPLADIRRLSPQMASAMSSVPAEIWELLEPGRVNWLSQGWRAQFLATLRWASPTPLAGHIAPGKTSSPVSAGIWE